MGFLIPTNVFILSQSTQYKVGKLIEECVDAGFKSYKINTTSIQYEMKIHNKQITESHIGSM